MLILSAFLESGNFLIARLEGLAMLADHLSFGISHFANSLKRQFSFKNKHDFSSCENNKFLRCTEIDYYSMHSHMGQNVYLC